MITRHIFLLVFLMLCSDPLDLLALRGSDCADLLFGVLNFFELGDDGCTIAIDDGTEAVDLFFLSCNE